MSHEHLRGAEILVRLLAGKLPNAGAARLLGLTMRQVRRLPLDEGIRPAGITSASRTCVVTITSRAPEKKDAPRVAETRGACSLQMLMSLRAAHLLVTASVSVLGLLVVAGHRPTPRRPGWPGIPDRRLPDVVVVVRLGQLVAEAALGRARLGRDVLVAHDPLRAEHVLAHGEVGAAGLRGAALDAVREQGEAERRTQRDYIRRQCWSSAPPLSARGSGASAEGHPCQHPTPDL